MKYKTLFRLSLKAVGLFFVIQGVLGLIPEVVIMIHLVIDDKPPSVIARFPRYIDNLMAITLGLYLFFGGKWIVNKAIPSNRPYCNECGYELRNLTNNCCSECGTTTQDTNKTTETTNEKQGRSST